MRYKTSIYKRSANRLFYIITDFERTFDDVLQNVDKMIKSCEIPIIVYGETFFHTIFQANHIPCYLPLNLNNACRV